MDKRNIQLHSPIDDAENNPAIREDLIQPVTQEQWEDLPTNKKGQFTNAAFVYDAERNSNFCPMG